MLENISHTDIGKHGRSQQIAGIFGTILCGWLSDKVFKGRRGPVTIIYMLLVMLAVYIYWNSASAMVTNVAMAAIGFLIYGPKIPAISNAKYDQLLFAKSMCFTCSRYIGAQSNTP